MKGVLDSGDEHEKNVVPRLDINEEWISDKTQFCYDGLKWQRLNDPMIRGPDGRFKVVSWRDALAVVTEVANKVKPEEIVGIARQLSDAESMMALKDLLNRLGSNNVSCEGNDINPQADIRSSYLLNTSISELEKADAFLIIGSQPRVEAPMVNARIRKIMTANKVKVVYIDPPTEFNYDHQHLGTGHQTLLEIAEGHHPFCSTLLYAKNPAIIVESGVFERKDNDAIFAAVETISNNVKVTRPDWNGLNVLLLNVAALDLGLLSDPKERFKSAKLLYLMGANDVSLENLPNDAFVVYQGHLGDKIDYRANVILPSVAFSKKEDTYENTEGYAQLTLPAVPTVGDTRDDWKIVRALSEVAGVCLPYDTLAGVRWRMRQVTPNLLHVEEREPSLCVPEVTQSTF